MGVITMGRTARDGIVLMSVFVVAGCVQQRPIQEKTEFELRREMQQQITEARFIQVPVGGIVLYISSQRDLPANWVFCDGEELPTDGIAPELRASLPDGRLPRIEDLGGARFVMRVR